LHGGSGDPPGRTAMRGIVRARGMQKTSHIRKVVFRSRRGRERDKAGPRARRRQTWVTAHSSPRAQWDARES